MRFEIARSLNGDKIIYIARDSGGTVRLREETLETLEEAIKKYNETLAKEAAKKPKNKRKEITTENVDAQSVEDTESPLPAEVSAEADRHPLEESGAKKKFLHSNLKEKIEEKKKKSAKKSFWDKLK